MGGGSCTTGYNLSGQPRELVEGAATQQIIIGQPTSQPWNLWKGSHPTDNWSAIGGGSCTTGYNLLGQLTASGKLMVVLVPLEIAYNILTFLGAT